MLVDASYVKMRWADRIVSVAVIVAVRVNSNGRREILRLDIGPSEAETFWTTFLRKLPHRDLRGVKLVISDAHQGIKAALAKVLNAPWQRCRVTSCATFSRTPARADAGSSPPHRHRLRAGRRRGRPHPMAPGRRSAPPKNCPSSPASSTERRLTISPI
jgi:putative transposase